MAVREKIDSLFAYRKLTHLLEISQLKSDKTFIVKLKELQYKIYLLDAYLEGHWDLEKKELDLLWTGIIKALEPFDFSKKEIKSLLSEIKEYERIERNCRKNKWPVDVSFRKFYTIKSCDVRLIRHLIYKTYPGLSVFWDEDSWVYYDRITEINDDISDIDEDLKTYNGNRFLISILRKGSLRTLKQYNAYLERTTAKSKSYFKKQKGRGENAHLLEWTLTRAEETLLMLDHLIESSDPELYSSSLLFKHMK